MSTFGPQKLLIQEGRELRFLCTLHFADIASPPPLVAMKE